MKNTPKIVKDLMKEEELGKLRTRSQGSHEDLKFLDDFPEESSEDTSDEVVDIGEEKKFTNHNDIEMNFQISSEDRYRLIAENTSDLISITTFSLKPVYTYVSSSFKRILGYEPEEMIGKNSFDFIHPDDKKNLTPLIKKYLSMKTKKLFTGKEHKIVEKFECRLRDKSGNWHYVENTANLIGKEILFIGKEITEQKKKKDEINSEKVQLLSIFDSMDEIIYVADPKTYEILYVNPKMQKIHSKNLVGETCYKAIQNKDAPCEFCTNHIIFKDENKGKPYRWEFHNPIVDRNYIITNRVVKWPDGRDVRFELAVDITDRKKTEERFRMIAKVSTDLIYEWNVKNDILEWFGNFDEVLGYKEGEIPRNIEAWAKLIHPDDLNKLKDSVKLHRKSTVPIYEEYRIRKKDGTWLYWKDKGIPILDESGLPFKWIGGCTNITEHKKAEEAKKHADSILERRNTAFRVLYDTAIEVEGSDIKEIFQILCRNLRKICKAKYAALASYDYETSHIKLEAIDIDEKDNHLIKKEDFDKTFSLTKDIVDEFRTEQVRICKNHHNCLVDFFPDTIIPEEHYSDDMTCYRLSCVREGKPVAIGMVQLSSGKKLKMKDVVDTYLNLAGMIIERIYNTKALEKSEMLFRDLSKNLEHKVQERTTEVEKLLLQKDEFIGQLGHDLKNPLNPLVNLLPVLEEREHNSETKKIFEVVNRNVEYMRSLVVKTIELARLNSPNTELTITETNLLDEVNSVVEKNKLALEGNNMKINNNIDRNIIVKMDKLRFEELFDNLINNAIKYSKGVGNISIDAKEDKDFVTISVKDTGIGITKEQLSRIFDEFYKADWARHDFYSSGLGLAICKRIVEKHGGKIWAESKGEGKGTTMFFSLPTSSEKE